MTADFKLGTNLAGGVLASLQLASGEQTVYAVPASSAAKIATCVLCNASVSPVSVSVSLVKSTGTAGATNRVVSGYSLAAGDSTSIGELAGSFLGTGDFISVNASTGSAVVATITGAVSS